MLPKSFLKHLRQHEGTQLFCMYCGVVTSKADDLIPHIDRTHWHSTFQCALCLYRASTKEHIECHFAHAHPNKSARHVTVVTMKDNAAECVVARLDGSQPYCCGFKKCSFQTMKTTNFVEHLRAVHPDEPSYPCPLCEDLKEDVGSLVAHFPEHGINNVQCAYCQHCSVTIGGIMLHLSYCHPDNLANFLFRNSDLEREFMQVVNDNGRVSSHYLIDLVREKSATMCRDLEHILLQQQCPFCTAWCGGFRAFSAHVLEKHRAAVHSHELAEVLFQSYDYKDAVALGRCPFCPFIADSTAELQEHVLDEELVYAPYECHLCMRTYRTEKDLDEHLFDKHVDEQKLVFHNPDTQLLAWVRSNIVIRRDKRSSSSLGETSEAAGCQDDVSYNLPSADSLQVAKPTQNTCPGPSTRCVHSDDGSAPCTEEFVTGQYSCPTCSLKTFSQTFFRRHVETCSDNCTPDVPRPVEGQPAGGSHDGITCGVCAARLSDYQAFVQHSRDAHDLGFTCSICCRAYKKKANLARHTTTIHKEGHSLRRESVDDTKALESGIRGSAAEGRPAGTKELRSHDGTGSAASCHGSARAGEEGSSSCRLDDPPGNTNQLYLRIGQTKVLVDTYLQLVDLEPYVVLRDLVSTLF